MKSMEGFCRLISLRLSINSSNFSFVQAELRTTHFMLDRVKAGHFRLLHSSLTSVWFLLLNCCLFPACSELFTSPSFSSTSLLSRLSPFSLRLSSCSYLSFLFSSWSLSVSCLVRLAAPLPSLFPLTSVFFFSYWRQNNKALAGRAIIWNSPFQADFKAFQFIVQLGFCYLEHVFLFSGKLHCGADLMKTERMFQLFKAKVSIR